MIARVVCRMVIVVVVMVNRLMTGTVVLLYDVMGMRVVVRMVTGMIARMVVRHCHSNPNDKYEAQHQAQEQLGNIFHGPSTFLELDSLPFTATLGCFI